MTMKDVPTVILNKVLVGGKKNKSIVLSDGTEAWDEEKLCNPCSIHWNKNGFHRHVRPKAPAQPCLNDVPSRSSSSRPRRSCSTTFAAAPSSPTASITKSHSTLPRRARHSRSPCQLTLAAEKEEREARIVQRSLAKACAKSEALKQKQKFMKIGYISEEDELFNNPLASPPLMPPRSQKRSARKTHRSSIQPTNLPSIDLTSPDSFLFNALPDHASPDLDLHQNLPNDTKTQYPIDLNLASFMNQNTSHQVNPAPDPLLENAPVSPPRTPPPNSHVGVGKHVSRMDNSPSHLLDFDSILSPSFLNASPNSLLRRLNSQKAIAEDSGGTSHLSAMCMSNFPSNFSEKVFSPNRPLASNSPTNPTPPMAEPIKKAEVPSYPRLIGSAGLLDAHMNSESSIRSKKSIFSPPRPAAKSKEPASRKSKSKSVAMSPENVGQIFGSSSKARRSRKACLDEILNGTKSTMHRSNSHVEPGSSSKRMSDPSFNQPNLQSTIRSQAHTKQHMARTIWSRRLESAGLSSEDSHLEERLPKKIGSRPASESYNHSETNVMSAPIDRILLQTGLSSAVSKGLNRGFSTDGRVSNRFGSGVGYSDGNMVSASSPPVLPPPSDCSEGITPHSAEPQSDDGEKEPKKPSTTAMTSTMLGNFQGPSRAQNRTQFDYDYPIESYDWHAPLSDITPSLNQQIQHDTSNMRPVVSNQNQSPSQHNNDIGLTPEIMSALNEAIKAGLSADELAQVLRNMDNTSSNITTTKNENTTMHEQVIGTFSETRSSNNNNHQNNPMDQLITQDSFIKPLVSTELDLNNNNLFQDNFDPNTFFLPPDPISTHPPIIPSSNHNNDDDNNYIHNHLDLHHSFGQLEQTFFQQQQSDLNIDPNLLGDIESIFNHQL